MRNLLVAPVAILVMTLAGCGQPAKAPTEAAAGLVVSEGKLVLPAVKGNSAAAYFTLANKGSKAVHVAAIDIEGAGMAMLHETREENGHSTMVMLDSPEVKPGESLTLSPGGKHVMVDGLPAGLAPGGTVPMVITLDDGNKLTAPLAVTAFTVAN